MTAPTLPKSRPLRIAHLFPSSMGLYGDRGNALALIRRCGWRGIRAELKLLESVEGFSFDHVDVVLLGGGADRDQLRVAELLASLDPRAFAEAVEDGLVVLAVCGGYQFLGLSYTTADGEKIDGLGILPVVTEAGRGPRLIGNVLVSVPPDLGGTLVGFENHGGRTWILGRKATPLGFVTVGHGNNGEDGTEGCRYRNCFGTYLHGPVLPNNPAFADRLVACALARALGEDPASIASSLPKLPDKFEASARRRAMERMLERRPLLARIGLEF